MADQAEVEGALLQWSERLAEKERTLLAMQTLLIDWSENLTKMARIIDEIRVIERGESHAAASTEDRPTLRLVPPVQENET